MTKTYLHQIGLLCRRLAIGYLLLFITRFAFFIYNRDQFADTGWIDFIKVCFMGLRFDSFSIAAANSLFILLSLMPSPLFARSWFQTMLTWLFMIANTLLAAANLVDAGYFAFIRKRSTADLFAQLGGQSDVISLLPRFLADFWLLVLVFIAVMIFTLKLYQRTIRRWQKQIQAPNGAFSWPSLALCSVLFLLITGLAVLAIRGGFQRVPIDVVNAGSMVKANEIPLVLNTPFTLIKSVNRPSLSELNYFSEEELAEIYSPVHHYHRDSLQKKNVVVIILESFSKEYTRLGGNLGLTPFFDSLMRHGRVYRNGYANGTKSIEGIPAILSSLPSLLDDPVINSVYATNEQTTFASLLGNEGYATAFFHGGINGTMNFDDWSRHAGYQKYYGRNEYMNDKDFDGYWGIWDEPFMQFAALKMNEMKQPFHTALFTLSSHHPYFVPKKYRRELPEGPLENSASIRYADLALRRFFKSISETEWYKNTLFVLVADHSGISGHPFYSNVVGYLSIPIVFYLPDNSLAGEVNTPFSQIDILPETMQMLGYNKPFFAFGKGFRHLENSFCTFYSNGSHYLFSDTLAFFYVDHELKSTYNFFRDSGLAFNIVGKYQATEAAVTKKLRAFLQSYHRTLVRNEGVVKLQ